MPDRPFVPIPDDEPPVRDDAEEFEDVMPDSMTRPGPDEALIDFVRAVLQELRPLRVHDKVAVLKAAIALLAGEDW